MWVLAELDINFFHDDEYEIWKVVEPGAPMYDLSGRTTSKEPDSHKRKKALGRVWLASLNVDRQNRVDHMRTEGDSSIELGHGNVERLRDIWAIGSELAYAFKGTDLTWLLLTHSLSNHPEDVIIEENVSYLFDEIIDKIRNNKYFRKKINEYLVGKTESFPIEQTEGIHFGNSGNFDLQSAINKCELWFAGEKNEDGSWNLEIELKDTFDFTEFKNPLYKDGEELKGIENLDEWEFRTKGDIFASTANDFAYISQKMGAITPFDVVIRFTMVNYVVSDEVE